MWLFMWLFMRLVGTFNRGNCPVDSLLNRDFCLAFAVDYTIFYARPHSATAILLLSLNLVYEKQEQEGFSFTKIPL